MRTIHRAKPITADEWVHRLNALARQMDERCVGVHPSAWHDLTEELRAEFQRVVQMPTQDPPEQLSLFDEYEGKRDEQVDSIAPAPSLD